jgi:hypothetical protein
VPCCQLIITTTVIVIIVSIVIVIITIVSIHHPSSTLFAVLVINHADVVLATVLPHLGTPIHIRNGLVHERVNIRFFEPMLRFRV